MRELRDGEHWVYPRNVSNPRDEENIVVTIGDRTDTLQVAQGLGAHVLRWTTADSGEGRSVQLCSVYGGNGRSLQTAMFVFENGTGPFWHNPTQAGSNVDLVADAGQGDFTPGYVAADVQQGAPFVRHYSEDLGSGSYRIVTVPLLTEWNTFAKADAEGGGTLHDMIVYPKVKAHVDKIINWNGNAGIHKITGSWRLPIPFPVQDWISTDIWGIHMRYGWDEVHAYSEGIGYTRLDGVQHLAGLSSPSLTGCQSFNDVVVVGFTADHGRAEGDIMKVTMSGWAIGSANINGTHLATFSSASGYICYFTVAGSGSETYTGGSISSFDVDFATFDNNQARWHFSNMMRINPITSVHGDDLQGWYFNTGLFGSGRSAMVYRSLSVGGNAWSFDEDLALAHYVKGVGTGYVNNWSNDGEISLTQWLYRGASAPTGVENELASSSAVSIRIWGSNSSILKEGNKRDVAFLLLGTWSEVQASITALDAMDDSIFDVDEAQNP
jgi:hypothetical protein